MPSELDRSHVAFGALTFFSWLALSQQAMPIYFEYLPRWRCEWPTPADNGTEYGMDDGGELPTGLTRDCAVLERCAQSNGSAYFERAQFASMLLEFDMICGAGAFKAATVATTVQFAGVLIGAIGWGSAADLCGRRPVLIAIYSLFLLGCAIVAASPNWQTMTVGRGLHGLCCGGITTAGFSYIMEHMPADYRLPLRAFVNWGWTRLAMTLICWLCAEWRLAQAVVGAAAGLPCLLLVVFVLPESGQWLASRHRWLDARKAERRIEWINRFGRSDRAHHPKQSVGHPLNAADRSDECDQLPAVSDRRTYTVKDLFATKALAKLTIVLWIMWFVASLSSWPVDLVSASLPGNLYVNQVLFAVIIGLSKKIMYVMDTYVPRFSRRMLHQLPCCVVIVTFAAVTVLFCIQTDWSGSVATGLCVFGVMFLEYTWDACYLCSAEGFPTVVRGTGIGTGSMWARVASILAPQIKYLSAHWPALPYCVVVVATCVSLSASVALLPETKGLRLPMQLDDAVEAEQAVHLLHLGAAQHHQSEKGKVGGADGNGGGDGAASG